MSSHSRKISIRGGSGPVKHETDKRNSVTVCALGDLMLAGEWDQLTREGRAGEAFSDLGATCRDDDLVFANLEATLCGGAGTIAKEPRLVGEPETFSAALEAVGVDLACLANNHAFDALPAGFLKTRVLLEEAGILHLGAGLDAEQAARPLVVERGGVHFGWLAYTALDTRPSHVASAGEPGVNPLRAEVARDEVASLVTSVDHVIVSLHWGVEYCHVPSPEQVRLARSLIEAGASLVIGHHAHVIQGAETWGDGAIVYNLGNAVTTDLVVSGRRAIRQDRRTRSSYVLRAAFSRERLEAVELVPIRAPRGRVLVGDAHARKILEKANRKLAAGISPTRWKAIRLWEDVAVKTLRKLDPRVIASLRPRHFFNFFKNITLALRGQGPA